MVARSIWWPIPLMVQSFACFYTHMYIPVSATRGRASQTDIMNYYVRCRFRVGRHGLDFVWVHLQIDMQRLEIKAVVINLLVMADPPRYSWRLDQVYCTAHSTWPVWSRGGVHGGAQDADRALTRGRCAHAACIFLRPFILDNERINAHHPPATTTTTV